MNADTDPCLGGGSSIPSFYRSSQIRSHDKHKGTKNKYIGNVNDQEPSMELEDQTLVPTLDD